MNAERGVMRSEGRQERRKLRRRAQMILAAAIAILAMTAACETTEVIEGLADVAIATTPAPTATTAANLRPAEAKATAAAYADRVFPTPTIPSWLLNGGQAIAPEPAPRGEPRQPGRADVGEREETALRLLSQLGIAARGSETRYDRSDWADWNDMDGDCQNTRAEVLIAESASPVEFATEARCRVTTGSWATPWTGETLTAAGDMDIDHHVPLAHAHQAGAEYWSREKKARFSNDMDLSGALNATKAATNRAKGAKPPDEWRPPDETSWCRYAEYWIAVKTKWELSITPAELTALRDMLRRCG